MKHMTLMAVLLGVAGAAAPARAQEGAFDREIGPWHQKATLTCGLLQDMAAFDARKMLANLDDLDDGLRTIAAQYRTNPPREYAGDPLWQSYFEDLADNIRIVRERVERGQYRLAQKYCAQFCMTFGRMHRTNGRVTTTDVLFDLRAAVKATMDMVNAGNSEGARAQLASVGPLQHAVGHAIERAADARWSKLWEPLLAAYAQWTAAVRGSDRAAAVESFAAFLREFPALYQATF